MFSGRVLSWFRARFLWGKKKLSVQQMFFREGERKEWDKKETKEEEIEKEGRRSGWDAEKMLKEKATQPDLSLQRQRLARTWRRIWLRCYHSWLSFLLGTTVVGSNSAQSFKFNKFAIYMYILLTATFDSGLDCLKTSRENNERRELFSRFVQNL